MSDPLDDIQLPASVRLLKWLVMLLTVTMIVGVIAVVSVIVTRMPNPNAPPPSLPANISLPDGAKPAAVTIGKGWIAVVTTDDRILILNPDGTLRQEILISATNSD